MNLKKEAEEWMNRKHKKMEFNAYQQTAKSTAIYPPEHKVLYPALGLSGEAGEVANKVKKIVRDGIHNMPPDWREQLSSEIGDVLWYCSALATDLNLSLGTIASQNIDKLERRKASGKLKGSGDNR